MTSFTKLEIQTQGLRENDFDDATALLNKKNLGDLTVSLPIHIQR